MIMLLKLAWRNVLRNKRRTVLSGVGVGVGVEKRKSATTGEWSEALRVSLASRP